MRKIETRIAGVKLPSAVTEALSVLSVTREMVRNKSRAQRGIDAAIALLRTIAEPPVLQDGLPIEAAVARLEWTTNTLLDAHACVLRLIQDIKPPSDEALVGLANTAASRAAEAIAMQLLAALRAGSQQ